MIRIMDSFGPSKPPERKVISVSQLNREARRLLETGLPMSWVEGELSNIARPASGHWYFTLKDDQAQIRCAMFKNRNRHVQILPREGQAVVIRGRISLYEARGDYQLIAENMQDAGVGALQQQFEQLKKALGAEGLFDQEHKQLPPTLPKRIGVITSPTGAVIKDILNVLKRRFPAVPVRIYPVAVQGEAAADQIVAALDLAQHRNDCDVLILARGGGSIEDLWPFNEERVARAIFACEIPTISAIGHETDVTIADFVADVRAPTPSAAAELSVPDADTLKAAMRGVTARLNRSLSGLLQEVQDEMRWLTGRLRQCRPDVRIAQLAQRLDDIDLRLNGQIKLAISQQRQRLVLLASRLGNLSPKTKLINEQNRLAGASNRLERYIQTRLNEERTSLSLLSATLNTVGPQATLDRGYAIVNKGKSIVTSSGNLRPGDKLDVRFADGSAKVSVDDADNTTTKPSKTS